jgi:predicted HicB family RNase H-like nuclease
VNHYTYRAVWSPEDNEYVGLCVEFPSLSRLAPTVVEAVAGIERVVADVVADMEKGGEPIPVPLPQRHYSGKFLVRTSPELHARLTMEATEQGVSVNQWAVQKLAQQLVIADAPFILRLTKGDPSLVPVQPDSPSARPGLAENVQLGK